MTEEGLVMAGFVRPLSFSEVDDWPRGATSHKPSQDGLLEFLFAPGLPHDMDAVLERYRTVTENTEELGLVPYEPTFMQKLVWPLRHAKACYMLGNYIGTIALCGMVCEMLAILLYEMSPIRLGPAGRPLSKAAQKKLLGATFERHGQERRAEILCLLGVIDDELKSKFGLVRTNRNKYLHALSHEHGDVAKDAATAYRETLLLVVKGLGYTIKDGRFVFHQRVMKYLADRGLLRRAGEPNVQPDNTQHEQPNRNEKGG